MVVLSAGVISQNPLRGVVLVMFPASVLPVKTLDRMGMNNDSVVRLCPLGGAVVEPRHLSVLVYCHWRANLDLVSRPFQCWCATFSEDSYLIYVTILYSPLSVLVARWQDRRSTVQSERVCGLSGDNLLELGRICRVVSQ